MQYVKLPNTDLNVSPVCLGCWQFNGGEQSGDKTWAAQPEQVSKSILDRAVDLGINFIDTAEAYLNSEKVLGRILDGRRKNFVIATKVGHRLQTYKATDLEESLMNSLRNLQTDYIDLYQLHWPAMFQDNLGECIAELKRQQAKGVIRNFGVCNHGPKNVNTLVEHGISPVTNQLPYNLLWRAVEYEVLPACCQKEIGVLAYSPLQQGLLTGKFRRSDDVPEGRRRTRLFSGSSTTLSRHGGEGAEKQVFTALAQIQAACDGAGVSMSQAALSWIMSRDPVKAVIVGASSPQQLDENVHIIRNQQQLMELLTESTEELKSIFQGNADLWQAESRMA